MKNGRDTVIEMVKNDDGMKKMMTKIKHWGGEKVALGDKNNEKGVMTNEKTMTKNNMTDWNWKEARSRWSRANIDHWSGGAPRSALRASVFLSFRTIC